MRNLRQTIFLTFGLLLLLALPKFSFSQIELTADDLLGQIGSTQIVQIDPRSSIPVDVGSPGANQVWDFRNQVIPDSLFLVFEVLRPDQTDFATVFPDANFVHKETSPNQAGHEGLAFVKVTSNSFIILGEINKTGVSTSIDFEIDSLFSLPLTFEQTWLQTERDTTDNFPVDGNIHTTTTLNQIDGWGTVQVPAGEFECIRLRQDFQRIRQRFINGMVSSTTVEDLRIEYQWMTKEALLVVVARSEDGETNPNFTTAATFGMLDSLKMASPTGIATNLEIPTDFSLSQNYPNPFNPQTVIKYRTASEGRVELVIFNLLGEKVRVMVNEIQSAGAYESLWDGTDSRGNAVSSGVYIYRLTSGTFRRAARMVLLR